MNLDYIELKVLQLLAEGHSQAVVAKKTYLSSASLARIIRDIKNKLYCDTMNQVIAVVVRLDWISVKMPFTDLEELKHERDEQSVG